MGTASAEDLARCDGNYFEAWRSIGRLSGGGEVREFDGVTIVATGPRIEWANIAFITRQLADPLASIAAIQAFFDSRGAPFIVRLREGVDPATEAALIASGIAYSDTVPGMFLANARELVAPQVPGLSVERVTGPAQMGEWLHVVSESFGLPRDAADTFFGPRYFHEPGIENYLGSAEGTAVATSTLLVSHGISGVHNVGTLASHRRRGIGEALTAHAVRRGVELGCPSASLQASEMGRPIYERMGFKVAAPYRTFLRRPS